MRSAQWAGLLMLVCAGGGAAQEGNVVGRVVSAGSGQPVAGARVALSAAGMTGDAPAAVSDAEGRFVLRLPAGVHVLAARAFGHAPRAVTDVVVRPDRPTVLTIELERAALELEGIAVRPGFFRRDVERPTSAVRLSAEEIRRAPASAGDVSRAIASLPSVSQMTDLHNGLAVRGGSVGENAFFVDGIAVANINHFPAQGTSGGSLALIDIEHVGEVRFQAGGFPAHFGHALSSVVEIDLREGSRDALHGRLDLNFAGFGGAAEGPLPGGGSFLGSVRRSYFDLLVRAVDVGTAVAPRYGDAHVKLAWSPGRHRISTLVLASDDAIRSDSAIAADNAMLNFGSQRQRQLAGGGVWRAPWSERLQTEASLSLGETRWDEDYTESATLLSILDHRSRERSARLRLLGRWSARASSLTLGAEARRLAGRYDAQYGAYENELGARVPGLVLDGDLGATDHAGFLTLAVTPHRRVSATLGARADHFGAAGRAYLSPRGSLRVELSDATALGASAGVFRQSLPHVLLAQQPAHRDLDASRAAHLVLALEQRLADDTRLTVEAYRKRYSALPFDPDQPRVSVLDEPASGHPFFEAHDRLLATGIAEAEGLEALLQKKLARSFYGLASLALTRSRYRDGFGEWRDRPYDNRFIYSVDGGWRGARWEFSGRWVHAGGRPYTPIDVAASSVQNRTVLDGVRVNEARYPDYRSLSVRADRRFHFRERSLVAYVSLWNALNRRNIEAWHWNPTSQRVEAIRQFGLLPVFGVQYGF